jgi:hypothetical protein
MKRADWNLLICLLASAALVSCGAPGIPIPPALELPKAVTDLRAARKGDRVYLAWTVPSRTTDRQPIRHLGSTRICRSFNTEVTDCKNPVAEIPPSQFPLPSTQKNAPAPKVAASYVDTLPPATQTEDPSAAINYAVTVLNENGRTAGLSNQASVSAAPTLPPPHFDAKVESEGVLLFWECPRGSPAAEASPVLQYKLRIYRREQGKQADVKVGDLDYAACLNPQTAAGGASPSQYFDQTFEWEKRYDYRATVVTGVSSPGKPEVEVEGDDTPVVQVFAHDVFPPAVPTGVQAVFSGTGQAPFVDLVWSPDTEADLAGYNIFRREDGGQAVKLNSELVKAPAYRDGDIQTGKRYFYSVSAVDERNNESARSEETSEQIP